MSETKQPIFIGVHDKEVMSNILKTIDELLPGFEVAILPASSYNDLLLQYELHKLPTEKLEQLQQNTIDAQRLEKAKELVKRLKYEKIDPFDLPDLKHHRNLSNKQATELVEYLVAVNLIYSTNPEQKLYKQSFCINFSDKDQLSALEIRKSAIEREIASLEVEAIKNLSDINELNKKLDADNGVKKVKKTVKRKSKKQAEDDNTTDNTGSAVPDTERPIHESEGL